MLTKDTHYFVERHLQKKVVFFFFFCLFFKIWKMVLTVTIQSHRDRNTVQPPRVSCTKTKNLLAVLKLRELDILHIF